MGRRDRADPRDHGDPLRVPASRHARGGSGALTAPRAAAAAGVVVPWLRSYRRAWIGADVVAGLTAAAVVVPSAMAYASLAGLPVEAGLYTALVALPLYALVGSSPVLSVSVTSTIAVLTAGAIGLVGPAGDRQAATTLALLTALILAGASLLRLGFVTNFISTPVLVGFKAGMGLLIASSQLGKVLGIPFASGGFAHNVSQTVRHLGSASGITVLLAALTLALMLSLARFAPVVPGALAAVVLGIAGQLVFNLDDHGVALIEKIPSGLPSLAAPSFADSATLFPAALGVALMAAIESISAARSFARPEEPRVRPNREWIALGAANLGAAFVRGMPSGGGTSQTAVNARAGARSQLAGVVTALVVALALTLLASLFSKLPQATLGAIVLVAAVGLVRPADFRRILEVRRRDFFLGLAAAVAVVTFGALKGILIAVVLSMLTLLHGADNPPVSRLGRKRGTDLFRPLDEHPDDETIPGLLIVRPEGGIYFANADRVYDRLLELVDAAPGTQVLLVDGRAVPDLEYTGVEALQRLRRELTRRGIALWGASFNPRPLAMARVATSDPRTRYFPELSDAVAAFTTRTG